MKNLITSYTFDASAKTVTFTGITAPSLAAILLITNTTDGIIIYNFADSTRTGTLVGNILTLAYNTTTMDDGDSLQIWYEDASTSPATSAQLTTLQEQADLLRRIVTVKMAEPWALDSTQRPRVALETIAASLTLTTVTNLSAITTFPYGQYWEMVDRSHTAFALNLRSRLSFS